LAFTVRYENNLHFQHGHATHKIQYISQKLRQLRRFLIVVRSLHSRIHQLCDCICRQNLKCQKCSLDCNNKRQAVSSITTHPLSTQLIHTTCRPTCRRPSVLTTHLLSIQLIQGNGQGNKVQRVICANEIQTSTTMDGLVSWWQ